MNLGLHGIQRHAEGIGDFLIAVVVEQEHLRHRLVVSLKQVYDSKPLVIFFPTNHAILWRSCLRGNVKRGVGTVGDGLHRHVRGLAPAAAQVVKRRVLPYAEQPRGEHVGSIVEPNSTESFLK